MPRSSRHVKSKTDLFSKEYNKLIARGKRLKGVIDLHFHGAYGIDLMICPPEAFQDLCRRLYKDRVVGFYPTTLTAPWATLLNRLQVLGDAILAAAHAPTQTKAKTALPLGIHLEGPFLNPKASGAHRPEWCLVPTTALLNEAWESSRRTLKIVTLAPELLSPSALKEITAWAKSRSVFLSIGHTKATYTEATAAFKAGFKGVTHAFNAMNFHHREPGVVGAALDFVRANAKGKLANKQIWIEAVGDGIHVHPALLDGLKAWFPDSLCLVSDCAPCASLEDGGTATFSDLKVTVKNGAAFTEHGTLAGGAKLLSQQKNAVTQTKFNLINPSQLLKFKS